jgi:2-octaprenyl-6-methoxyphenol hydroxylase
MTKRTNKNVDVTIIGGGLMGMVMACSLAQNNVSVIVIEAEELAKINARESDGRTSAISSGSAKIFDSIGIWQDLLKHSGEILDIRVSDGDSPLFLHYDHALVGDEPMGHIIENHIIRKALFERASKLKTLEILDSCRYVSIERNTNNAITTLENGDKITSALIIAADGRNSRVRSEASIHATQWSYNQSGIVCTVKHEKHHHGVAVEKFLPAGPFAILPMCGGHHSSLVWTEKTNTTPLFMKMSDAEFLEQLQLRFGDFLGKLEVVGNRFSYPLSLSLARQYSETRLALIGDAAHAMHPIAGQGFNLGIRDVPPLTQFIIEAKNLGLDIGSSSVLEKYSKARKFDNISMLAITDLLTRLFSNDIPPIKYARRIGLATVNKLPILKKFFIKHAMGE